MSKQYFDIGKIKQRQGISKKSGEAYTIRTLNLHANEKTISSLRQVLAKLEVLAKNETLEGAQKNVELSLLAPGSERFPATPYTKDGVTHTVLNRVALVVEDGSN